MGAMALFQINHDFHGHGSAAVAMTSFALLVVILALKVYFFCVLENVETFANNIKNEL